MITNELKENNLTYQRNHPKTIIQIEHFVCWTCGTLEEMNFGHADRQSKNSRKDMLFHMHRPVMQLWTCHKLPNNITLAISAEE